MTKYFDKLLKIKFYVILLPITWKHEKQCHFEACGFLLKFIDIINKNIFHYLMSKNPKEIFI